MVLKSLKIKVNNPEESKIAQEWAFKQGYKWADGTGLQGLNKLYLYFYSDSFIRYGAKDFHFLDHGNKEIFIYNLIDQFSNEIWY